VSRICICASEQLLLQFIALFANREREGEIGQIDIERKVQFIDFKMIGFQGFFHIPDYYAILAYLTVLRWDAIKIDFFCVCAWQSDKEVMT
jgi:hypothetical protein